MTNDRFWLSFWLLSISSAVICIAVSAALFFHYVGGIDATLVGVSFDASKDPFAMDVRQAAAAVVVIKDGYIYKDALPLGASHWTWSSRLEVRSNARASQGSYSMRAVFSKEWSGFGVSGFTLDSNVYQSLALSVYPDSNVGDLYVELYDKNGNTLGRQSLGFYTNNGALAADSWNKLLIPVENLIGSTTRSTITAISITATAPGVAYVDSVQFNNTESSHAKWFYQPPEGPGGSAYVPPPYNPFATSTPVALPYTLVFKPQEDDNWYSPRGVFRQDYDAFRLGPKKGITNAGFAYFRAGKLWGDYQASAKVAWGTASVFAINVRMQDESNYVSCSFSGSGDTIQMYRVKDGVSSQVAESDKLHYADYTGGVAMVGARISGDTLSCGVDGKQILTEKIEGVAERGTVGFEAWDQNDATTPHQIQEFKVSPITGE